jgi:hypothetical protein
MIYQFAYCCMSLDDLFKVALLSFSLYILTFQQWNGDIFTVKDFIGAKSKTYTISDR